VVSTVFAPPGPAAGPARQVTNPNTGNSYAFNGQGAAVVADADAPWFLTQGYTATPAAGAGAVVYAPFMPDQGMARVITHPISGNSYVFNGAGAAVVSTADLPWFLSQGYVQLPSGTVMQEPLQPGLAAPGVITNPNTGNTYVVNGRGLIVAQAADVPWFTGQGFVASGPSGPPVLTRFSVTAPATASTGAAITVTVTALDQFGATFPGYAGTVHFTSTDGAAALPANSTLTAGVGTFPATLNTAGNQTITATDTVTTSITGTSGVIAASTPAFPPQVGGVNPTLFGDFAGSQYWAAGVVQSSFAAWMTAIGATYSRASTATYMQGGVVKTAAANVMRFPTDAGGAPLGIRLTGAATNLHLHSAISDSLASYSTQGTGTVLAAAPGTPDPSGGSAAISLTPGATTGQSDFFWTAGWTAVASTPYAFSVFAKPNGYTNFQLDIDVSGNHFAQFSMVGAGSVLSSTGVTAVITALANGWYLCSIAAPTLTGSGNTNSLVYATGNGTNRNFTSDGVSGYFFWGMQVTQSTFQADYIPTTTATVTQAADAFSFPFTQTTYSALVGTNGILFDGSGAQRALADNNVAGIWVLAATQFGAWSASSTINGPTITNVLNPHKTMIAGNSANVAVTSDGLTPSSYPQGINASAPTSMTLGGPGGFYGSGNYSQLGIWNGIVASNADLIRLTQ
jgi:hypothetical protein